MLKIRINLWLVCLIVLAFSIDAFGMDEKQNNEYYELFERTIGVNPKSASFKVVVANGTLYELKVASNDIRVVFRSVIGDGLTENSTDLLEEDESTNLILSGIAQAQESFLREMAEKSNRKWMEDIPGSYVLEMSCVFSDLIKWRGNNGKNDVQSKYAGVWKLYAADYTTVLASGGFSSWGWGIGYKNSRAENAEQAYREAGSLLAKNFLKAIKKSKPNKT